MTINLNLVPRGFLPASLSASPGNGPIAGYTASYNLNLVNFDWVTWHDYEWQNWAVVDTLLSTALGALEISGAWKPNTAYALNEIVVDTRGGGLLICTNAHTSSEDLDADIAAGKWADYDVSGAPVTVSATEPVSPIPGDLWFATTEPVGLYIWYNDGNSAQWVQTNGGEGTADLPISGGTLLGDLGIENTRPQLLFHETDMFEPDGRYRLIASAGNFYCQKALTFDWSSGGDTIWQFTDTTDTLTFSKPTTFIEHVQLPLGGTITDPILEFGTSGSGVHVHSTGEIYLVRSEAAALSCLIDGVRVPGVFINESSSPYYSWRETDQTLPDGRARLQLSSNALRFIFNTAPTGDYSASITSMRVYKDKIELDVPVDANANELAGALKHKIDAGYMYIGSRDSAAYGNGMCRLWHDHDGKMLHILDTDETGGAGSAMGILASNWEVNEFGNATFGSTRIDNTPSGGGASGAVSAVTGVAMDVYSGLTTGVLTAFRDNDEVASAYIYPGSTSVPSTLAVITREKGDARYAAISSERYKDAIHAADERALAGAFNGLTLREWVWGGELPDTDERVGRSGVGVIAEELVEVVPSAATYKWEGDDTDKLIINGADPLALIAVLVAKIREQDERIAALEAR